MRRFLGLGWIDRERLRGYSIILLIVSLPALVHFYRQAMGPVGSDFLAFWSAGKLAVMGKAHEVYDLAATGAVQAQLGRHDVFAFVNPPPFLFLATPLGLCSYPVAWAGWVAATYLFWLAMTRRALSGFAWPIAAFPGASVAAWHAQTGLLTGGLLAGVAAQIARRPMIAGFCTGTLIIKPHLGLLFPVAYLAGRHWRALAGAGLSAVGLILLAWQVFGTDTILAYPRSWAVSRAILDTGGADFFLRQSTVYAAVRLFTGAEWAMTAQAVVSGIMVILIWKVWRESGDMEGKMACLLAATPLATPYLFNYDLPFLIVPICWLARLEAPSHGKLWVRPLLIMLYFAPLLGRAFAIPLGINPTPFALMILMAWIYMRHRAGHAANCA